MEPVTYKTKIERSPQLPRYVVIPVRIPAAWNLTDTTTVAGTLNGVDLGRRGLKDWGDGKRWFFEIPELLCHKAGVDTGDEVTLRFAPVENAIPVEIQRLLAADANFAAAWEKKLTSCRKRQLAEWVASAKQETTRRRRADSLVPRKRS